MAVSRAKSGASDGPKTTRASTPTAARTASVARLPKSKDATLRNNSPPVCLTDRRSAAANRASEAARAPKVDARRLPNHYWNALLAVSCSALLGGMPRGGERQMKLSIELNEAEGIKLRDEAARLGVEPEDLARAALADLLRNEDEEFRRAAEHVLRKNEELYRRLA